ncbi:ribose-phosphate diphosphokinase [Candidatus Nomurabacteria bacterium]|nr:ribose-phosphate diphosphokinase [Candidatus Nomurabacteria bacterium]
MQKLITPYAHSFGKPNVVIKHFPDSESYILIPQIKSLKNKPITIYHSLYPEPDKRIFELLLILSRVKKETKNISLFVPYLPYARQDRECKTGEAVSADVLCVLLKNFGVKKLTTYDCHFLPCPGNFKRSGLNIENKSAGKELVKYAKKYFGKNKFLVISPDEGASYFTENAQGHALKKTRKREEHGLETEVHKIEGEVDVEGKNICILDDIIATGGTIVKAVEHLKARGAKRIIVGATHGVFAKDGIAKKIINANTEQLFITNSILKNNLESFIHVVKLNTN